MPPATTCWSSVPGTTAAPGAPSPSWAASGPYVSWQRNTNTGGNLATEPLSHGRVAHLTLMTGPGTGSELDLPQPDAGLLKPRQVD